MGLGWGRVNIGVQAPSDGAQSYRSGRNHSSRHLERVSIDFQKMRKQSSHGACKQNRFFTHIANNVDF
jgi:hypothetical protein